MGFGPSHAVLPCGGTRISAGLHPIKSLYMSSGKDLHSQKVSVVDNDVLRSFYSSRRKVIFPIGAGLLTAFLGSRAGEAADLAESFMEEMGGSDFQGVDVKFAFPKTWKFDRKEGTLLVNDEARAACDADPDKCLFGEVFARSPGGDSAYLLQSTTSSDGDVTMIPFSFFKTQVFNRGGKFGEEPFSYDWARNGCVLAVVVLK